MKSILITSVALFCLFTASAQKAQVEKALQDKYMKEHGNAGMGKLQEFMDNMNNATTRPEYKFPLALTMHITDYDKGVKKDETDMRCHINAADEAFAISGKDMKGGNKDMFMVYDSKNNAMVMLDEKKKTYTAMNMNALMSAEMQANRGKRGTAGNTKCTKTGKTKSIRGYACEEYVCIDPDKKESRVEVWVTNKIPVSLAGAAKGQPWGTYYSGLDGMAGMMMEGKMYEKGELEGTMEVMDINEKANLTVTLSNYKKNEMFAR